MKTKPKVSIIIPVRNEEIYIRGCLNSIVENDYPSDKIEILIVDGRSTDMTREIVNNYSAGVSVKIRLLDNPEKIVPKALNIGIEKATGDILFFVGGHSYVAEDYITKSVETLSSKEEVDVVGGPVLPEISGSRGWGSYIQRAVSLALSSPIASGSARFNGEEGYVNTVSFGAYRADVFEKFGKFDEDFVRTQDFEYNYRIVKSGGKIYMNPEIKSYYYPRSSFAGLWTQYFQYGFWKKKVIEKNDELLPKGNLVPPIFVLLGIISAISSIFSALGFAAFLLYSFSYAAVILSASIKEVYPDEWKNFFPLPLLFVIIHVGFGSGFLISFLLRKNFRPKFW